MRLRWLLNLTLTLTLTLMAAVIITLHNMGGEAGVVVGVRAAGQTIGSKRVRGYRHQGHQTGAQGT